MEGPPLGGAAHLGVMCGDIYVCRVPAGVRPGVCCTDRA